MHALSYRQGLRDVLHCVVCAALGEVNLHQEQLVIQFLHLARKIVADWDEGQQGCDLPHMPHHGHAMHDLDA